MLTGITIQKFSEAQWAPSPAIYKINDDVNIFRIPASGNGTDTEVAANFKAILSAEELRQMQRFRFPHLQENYQRSRYYLRKILSGFLGIPADKLQFYTVNDKKKPLIDGLSFNLSRSEDYIVLAVSKQLLGIDLEYINPDFAFTEISKDYFHKDEQEWAGNDFKRFFTIWTRKEAILKATAEGLVDDLSSFSTTTSSLQRAGFNLHLDTYEMEGNYLLSIARTDSKAPTFFSQI